MVKSSKSNAAKFSFVCVRIQQCLMYKEGERRSWKGQQALAGQDCKESIFFVKGVHLVCQQNGVLRLFF